MGVALLAIGVVTATSSARAQEVVVSPTVRETSVSRAVLRAIFGMRLRTWGDGSSITVFVLDDRSPTHGGFTKKHLSVFPHQLRQAWDRMVYSGTGQAPIMLATEPDMRARVAATPGGIGYLSREWVDDTVRILEIR